METRWTELCRTASLVVELATCLSDSGLSIFFLNRPPMHGVTSAAQVQAAFAHAPPQGFTPLTRSLRAVLSEKRQAISERKLLLVIATDGEPTNESGVVDIRSFLDLLRSLPATVHTSILACTDDDESVAYLNEADSSIPRLDVTDDFGSERIEVLRAQGQGFHFSFGDYVVKCLLGPVDSYFDSLDSARNLTKGGAGGAPAGQGDGCCAVA